MESLPLGAFVRSDLINLIEVLQRSSAPGHLRSSVDGLPPLGADAMSKFGRMLVTFFTNYGSIVIFIVKSHDAGFLERLS